VKGKPIRILCADDLSVLRNVGQYTTTDHAERSEMAKDMAHRQLVLVTYDPVHDGILWCWMRDFLSSFLVSFLKFSLPARSLKYTFSSCLSLQSMESTQRTLNSTRTLIFTASRANSSRKLNLQLIFWISEAKFVLFCSYSQLLTIIREHYND
jgi:hypothetical protein